MTVTVERLERALALAAYIVVLDGPIAAPLFDRLERELATARAAGDTVSRLAAYRTRVVRQWRGRVLGVYRSKG